jgi:hypothetical protein
MLKLQTWILCESSSRWATALRTAFARWRSDQIAPRLFEVRDLPDFKGYVNDQPYDLALVEVGKSNLADVLGVLAGHSSPECRFVALIDNTLYGVQVDDVASRDFGPQRIADVLWEAGATEVVESPRQLRGLLALGNLVAAAAATSGGGSAESQSIADWAWSRLPWQDA